MGAGWLEEETKDVLGWLPGGASTGRLVGISVGLPPLTLAAVSGVCVSTTGLASVGSGLLTDSAPGCDSSNASAAVHTAKTRATPNSVNRRWRLLEVVLRFDMSRSPCICPWYPLPRRHT